MVLPALLTAHIVLAVALFVPSVLLPFALSRQAMAPGRRGAMLRALLWLQTHGSLPVAAGVALTGVGLLAVLGPEILRQPWLLLALAVYVSNVVLAFFVQRPGLLRLVGFGARAEEDRDRWRARARRQRYVSYVMAAAVGVIAFLMTSKPGLR